MNPIEFILSIAWAAMGAVILTKLFACILWGIIWF